MSGTRPGADVRGFYSAVGIELPGWAQEEASIACFADPDAHARGDRDPSCSVNVETGAWHCWGCGAKGGAFDAALRTRPGLAPSVRAEGRLRPGHARLRDNRLQMAITRLRKALEPLNDSTGPRLRTVSGGYMLAVTPGELDAEVFATRVQDGLRALDAGDPGKAGELLSAALGLWRGPPLAEVAFEDFAQAEIRRLLELRLDALEARIEADLQQGAHARLVGELQVLLAEHPTRERVASQLMLALYRSGRQADALEVYQRIRAELAEQLGLEPGHALRTLQMQILEQAPSLESAFGREVDGSLASDSQHGPRGHVPRPLTALIGREQELETVCRLLEDADVRLVTLTGTGGVGKTRLAIAIARRLESSFADGVCWVELAGVSARRTWGRRSPACSQ